MTTRSPSSNQPRSPATRRSGRRSSKAKSSPASSTTPARAGRCSSSSPTRACASARRAASPGPTSTTTTRSSASTASSPANASSRRSRLSLETARSCSHRPSPSCLRERWLASAFKARHHLVWCNTIGRGLDYRDVGENFRQTIRRAGINSSGRLTLPSLRNGFAWLLIASGLNVVLVSRQLGHANANITLEVYAHLFERADHAATARTALDASHAALHSVS